MSKLRRVAAFSVIGLACYVAYQRHWHWPVINWTAEALGLRYPDSPGAKAAREKTAIDLARRQKEIEALLGVKRANLPETATLSPPRETERRGKLEAGKVALDDIRERRAAGPDAPSGVGSCDAIGGEGSRLGVRYVPDGASVLVVSGVSDGVSYEFKTYGIEEFNRGKLGGSGEARTIPARAVHAEFLKGARASVRIFDERGAYVGAPVQLNSIMAIDIRLCLAGLSIGRR